jgi:hypothetical protein
MDVVERWVAGGGCVKLHFVSTDDIIKSISSWIVQYYFT